jgi:integrase
MARHVRNPKVDSRTAREKLKPSGKPHYSVLGGKLHLGYRKGKSGGKWVLRRYVGDGAYVVETMAEADDFADADGVNVLTFHQAQDKARERAQALAEEDRIAALGPSVTVRDAIEAYLTIRDTREAQYASRNSKRRNARSRLTRHVLLADGALSAKSLAALTTDDLAKWREALASRVGAPERTVHDMKAALNEAVRRFQAKLPPDMRDTIRNGLAGANAAPVARGKQVLPDADVRRLIAAAWEVDADGNWDGDLGRLILILAATGARFSQVVRITVGDVQPGRLMIPTSRKGRKKKVTQTPVPVGDDVLAALAKMIAGRKGHEPLLLRPRWHKAAVGRWIKGARGPWGAVDELGRVWPAVVERAGLAVGTIPYALRHSSIVRGLRAGLPVRLVASVHDTSAAMVEQHYAAFIVDALNELAARAIVPLTTAPATVVSIERAQR